MLHAVRLRFCVNSVSRGAKRLTAAKKPAARKIARPSSLQRPLAASIRTVFSWKPSNFQQISYRHYSSGQPFKVVNKGQVEALIQGEPDSYVLIDVRDHSELQHGKIPTAQHIPLGNFVAEFNKPSDEFEDANGFPKPAPTDKIVLYCKAGMRSASAAAYLTQIGYRDVSNYAGFIDWFGRGY